MMTSKEIVQRTIDFAGPERVARSFGDSDILACACTVRACATDWREVGRGRWERTDEWGNTWRRVDPTSKGEVIRGVLEEISDMDSYEFPDYSRSENHTCVARSCAENPDKWLNGCIHCLP